MRAITIHQPWATLIAIGAKRIETRSWATAYRGPIAIHAGKSTKGLHMCLSASVRELLANAGVDPDCLPMGEIVCTARLLNCIQTDLIVQHVRPFTEQELLLGNYEPQRFGWLLTDVARIEPSIPAKGAQGLWEWQGSYGR